MSIEVLARKWHKLSDHAADGTPFGGGLCNCMKQAERVESIVADEVARAVEAFGALADEWEHPAEVYALRMSAAPRLRALIAEAKP